MKKVLKWIVIVIGGLVAVVAVAAIGLSFSATTRLNKTYTVQPAPLVISEDAAAIERGAYIYNTTCAGCHGDNLAGTPFFNDPALGSIPAPNLTAGAGGIGDAFSDTDWVRAIRHGIDPQGKPLMVMPSLAFWHFNDQDLGAVIAYIKSVPPVNNDLGQKALKPVGRILLSVGAFGDVLAAEVLEHNAPRPSAPPQAVTADYGQYLVDTLDCRSCHAANLAGGQSSEPGAPPSPDLTPAGTLSIWSDADFIQTMRTGTTPYSRQLDPAFMPYEVYGRLTDEDLTAIFLYLQSLPVTETTGK
jgi:mono/diheme cytochrome c family protein